MIPGLIILGITAVAVFSGASLTSVLGAQALALLIWTAALGIAIRKKWPSGAVFETVSSHKWCAAAASFLVVAHVIVAIVTDPQKHRYFLFLEAPPPGAAAVASFTMGLVAYGLGYHRKRVGMLPGYRWKTFHGLTACLSAFFAVVHVIWLGNLVYNPLWQATFLLLFFGSVVLVAVRLR